MNNVIYDHPILWGVILQSECVLHYIYGVKQTSCTLCRVLSDPPDRVGMRSAISQRARPRAGGGSINNQFRLWREAVRPQPVHLCPSTPPHGTQNNTAFALHQTSQNYYSTKNAQI